MGLDLKFNVIFIPRTVRYLRLAVMTLLQHSPYAFRLVSNGLEEKERRLLRDFCGTSDRLEYFHYPQTGMLNHGTMLNLLFAREDSPYFCMMDSDIFAIGPFAEALEKALSDCDVFSSCLPMSMVAGEPLTGFSGNCLRTPAGLALAPTYFSIYRTDLFRRIIRETKVGFEVFRPPHHFPDGLERFDLPDDVRKVGRLDTAKLLDMLASRFGARFHYQEFPNLVHIGGLSLAKKQRKRRLIRLLWGQGDGKGALTDQAIAKEIRKRCRPDKLKHCETPDRARQEEERLRAQAVKHVVANYFTHFLKHLCDGAREPEMSIGHEPLGTVVRRTTQLLRELHRQRFPNEKH